MMKPGMYGTRIHQMGESHLVYIAQPLVNGMGHNIQDQRVVDSNKTIDRVVDDFADSSAHAAKLQNSQYLSHNYFFRHLAVSILKMYFNIKTKYSFLLL